MSGHDDKNVSVNAVCLPEGCQVHPSVVCANQPNEPPDGKFRDAVEEQFNKGWEAWASKMGGDGGDGADDNFDAEELAVRLSTKVDKEGKVHAKILLQKIYHFWHCKQHTDMVLIAGTAREEVHLHMFLAHTEFYEKVVLISDSEKMWKEGKLVLDMSGLVAPKALKLIVGYVYTGALKVTLDNVTDIAMAAKAMGLRRLQQHCTEFLDYVFADFHLFTILRNIPVDHKFFNVAWTKVLKRFRRVCTNPAFLQLDVERLEMLIASDKIDVVSEYQIFRAVLAWINHDRPKREQHFFKLMGHVRFPYMDIEELISCMQEESLFMTNPEAQKILEEADMYATMESMGDHWSGYPPWPPRNDVIKRRVERQYFNAQVNQMRHFKKTFSSTERKCNLNKLRPKTKNEICNKDLPCYMQTDYSCQLEASCKIQGDRDKQRTEDQIKATQEKAELELFGLNEVPESFKNQVRRRVLLEGKETSTNRAQLLAQLRNYKNQSDVGNSPARKEEPSDLPTKKTSDQEKKPRTKIDNIVESIFSREPSEISLPACMQQHRNP